MLQVITIIVYFQVSRWYSDQSSQSRFGSCESLSQMGKIMQNSNLIRQTNCEILCGHAIRTSNCCILWTALIKNVVKEFKRLLKMDTHLNHPIFQLLENGDQEEHQTLEIPDVSRQLVELLLEVKNWYLWK